MPLSQSRMSRFPRYHVLRGQQEALDGGAQATLQADRVAALADLREKREVLHVAGATCSMSA